MASQKWNFLYALIITLVVFNLGIFFGYKLETSRINQISDWAFQAELETLDQQAQAGAFDVVGDLNCTKLIDGNIAFADRIYQEALKIDDYEKANRFNNDITLQHKRYDLLRTLFWMNSIKIKNKCNADYHTVVYIYQYNAPSLDTKSKQSVFSNKLGELKNKYGDKIMLIPIAGDNDILSIELLKDKYSVTELPVILVEEAAKFTEIDDLDNIEAVLK